jgi:formylglycine-generating enzyme required for sulfatase activity
MGHIFISYSHQDSEYAHALAANLQGMGFDTWIDERLDYGSQWPHELQKQLDTSSAFVLIMSPRSYASEWVQSELQRARRKTKPIFPLLLEGDEPWLSVESTQYYDVRGEKFPDAKFYSALGKVASPPEGQSVAPPIDAGKPVKPVQSSGRPRIKTEVMLAIIGAIATIIAAFVPVIWSNLSQNSSPPPTGTAESGIASTQPSSSNDSDQFDATATFVIPLSGETDVPSEFTDSAGVSMSLVPAGNFIAGSDQGYENEKPVHTVYLDNFYIDKYEVTNALYKVCVEAGTCQPPDKTGSFTRESYYGNPQFDTYPVVYVDWEKANSYCQWRGMSLPTEAQWEKAARGTDGRTYPWGNNIDQTYANYNNVVGDTTEVGNYESGKSQFGVYDMAGNAWEWVADWYSDTYYLNTPLTNPTGPTTGEYRVLRGGSWHDDKSTVTTSNRGWNQLEYFENVDFGFRCAMDGTP